MATLASGLALMGDCAGDNRWMARQPPKPRTLTAWKQKRRADVDCVVEQERTKCALAADAPAKLIVIEQVGRSAAVAEALFQRRKRFKRDIDNM